MEPGGAEPQRTVVDLIRDRASEQPDHPALVTVGDSTRPELPVPDAVISYAELVRCVDALADKLRADGARPGDRCGLVARQGRGFVEAALGIVAADLCLVPIPDDITPEALERFRSAAHLHGLVREANGLALERFEGVEAVDGGGDRAFRALRPAYLRFTSGTTHERKGVVLGHDAVVARLEAANRALAIGPRDRVLWLLPMAHHFVVSILLYLRYGATILLPASSLARPVLELCQRHPPSVLYASPYHYRLLAKDTSGLGLPGVRLAISTATGLQPAVARLFRERFGVALGQALGVIEVGLPAINLAHAVEKPGCLGQPLPDYEIRLIDEQGRPCAADAPERTGEICIRGPGMFDAYIEPWTPAREVVEPHGFRTGDQGWIDGEGDLHLAGRRANRINMAGMKFFAEEVEGVLDLHPLVRESRVVARPHEHLGDIPVAQVVPEDASDPPAGRDLVAFCRERLESYKVPRRIEIVGALPRTETGKVRRWD